MFNVSDTSPGPSGTTSTPTMPADGSKASEAASFFGGFGRPDVVRHVKREDVQNRGVKRSLSKYMESSGDDSCLRGGPAVSQMSVADDVGLLGIGAAVPQRVSSPNSTGGSLYAAPGQHCAGDATNASWEPEDMSDPVSGEISAISDIPTVMVQDEISSPSSGDEDKSNEP